MKVSLISSSTKSPGIVNNALFNAIASFFPLVLSLFLLPFIVGTLGAEAYGLLALVWTVIGYFSLLDLGIGNALLKYLAQYTAAADHNKANDILRSALLVSVAMGLAGAILILAGSRPLIQHLLKLPVSLTSTAYTVFSMAAAGFFLNMLLSVLSEIPRSQSRFDIACAVTTGMSAVTWTTNATLVLLGFGIQHIVALDIVLSFFGILLYLAIARRLLPFATPMPALRPRAFGTILHFGAFTFLSKLAYFMNYHIDRLVVGSILDVASITYYAIPFMVITKTTSIVTRMAMVIFPAISELQGSRRLSDIPGLYVNASRIVLILSIAACCPLLLFGKDLLALWMGPEFAVKSGTVVILLTISILFSMLTNVPSYTVDGLGLPQISGIASMINAAINVSLIIPAAKLLGLPGIATVFLLSNVVVTPLFVVYVTRKVVLMSIKQLFMEAYFRPLLSCLLFAFVVFLVPLPEPTSLSVALALCTGASFLFLLLCLLTGALHLQEIRSVLSSIKRLFVRNAATQSTAR